MESVDSAAARRTYLRLIEPVKGRIIGNVAIAALSSACEFVPYLAIARVAQLSITEGVPPSDVLAMWVLVAVAGAAAGRMLFSMATGRCHYADADFRVHVRTVLIEHLGKIPLGWFNDNSSAQVKQAATDDVLNLHQSVGHAPVDVTAALLSPLIPLVYLFTVDVRFALLLVAYFVVVIGVAWPFMMRDFGPLNKRFNEAMVEVSSAAVEMVEGIAVIKTFGSRSRAGARYRAATEELAKACYVWTKRNGNAFSWVSALFSPGAMLVVLLLQRWPSSRTAFCLWSGASLFWCWAWEFPRGWSTCFEAFECCRCRCRPPTIWPPFSTWLRWPNPSGLARRPKDPCAWSSRAWRSHTARTCLSCCKTSTSRWSRER